MNEPVQGINFKDVPKYVKDTPVGECCVIMSRDGRTRIFRETWAELAQLPAQLPGFMHVMGLLIRHGVMLFCRDVERTLFPAGSPENDLFVQRNLYWPTVDLPWVVVSFPNDPLIRAQLEPFLVKHRLRLVQGAPTFLEGQQPRHFPLDGETVFTLVYRDADHPAYQNDPRIAAVLRAHELEQVEAISEAFFGNPQKPGEGS